MDLRRTLSVVITYFSVVFAQTNDAINEDDTRPYCFRYTWLGPKFSSVQLKNRTCAALLGKAELICVQPLIITTNNQPPDPSVLWTNYSANLTHIACRLSPGDVCVKYTYIYNNAVENITYTCTKVSIENEGPATSGCYSQLQNGREIEVCVCESSSNRMPCNSAACVWINTVILLLMLGIQFNSMMANLIHSSV